MGKFFQLVEVQSLRAKHRERLRLLMYNRIQSKKQIEDRDTSKCCGQPVLIVEQQGEEGVRETNWSLSHGTARFLKKHWVKITF